MGKEMPTVPRPPYKVGTPGEVISKIHGAPEFRGKETSHFPIDRETHLP